MYLINENRITEVNKSEILPGAIVYWMTREQRAEDNWSLIYALNLTYKFKRPLCVVFTLADKFLSARVVHYSFMLRALKYTASALLDKNIPFFILKGEPIYTVPAFVKQNNVCAVITDFDPLKIKLNWQEGVAERIKIPFIKVDSHNIVPYNIASDKQEFAAYTIRPKINKHLNDFLDDYPVIQKFPYFDKSQLENSRIEILKFFDEYLFSENSTFKPGAAEARKTLESFIINKLPYYFEKRNNPELNISSNLSPYLHFGHISSQRIALEINKLEVPEYNKQSFLEELIIRKELSDNYCYYNKNYDNFDGFPDWAKKTLNEHRSDEREYLYSREEFENAETHDIYWNAAQIQMLNTGKMHGYMRMYWAKKILEWSSSPEEAIETAITLNDRYSLDGRDPNGYTGIAWSIGGVHDRAWAERKVFGKIRYMNANGLKRKFNIDEYARKYDKIRI